MIASLIGTEATSAILSRNILSILKTTEKNAKTEIEEYFINERINGFKIGWPIYVHFEFKDNIHLYNYDSIKWFEFFHKNMKKYKNSSKKYKTDKFVVKYEDVDLIKTNSFLNKTFYLKNINGEYNLELQFNDGTLKIDYKDNSFFLSYEGKRMSEISPLFE
jgi:hypothetical protein